MIAKKDIKCIQDNRNFVNPSSGQDENTGSFYGSLEFSCPLFHCTLVKSAYIFDNAYEAIEWAKLVLQDVLNYKLKEKK